MVRRINNARKCAAILEREYHHRTFRSIGKKYNISKTSAHRFVKEKVRILYPKTVETKRRGRKRKLSERDVRQLDRAVKDLRRNNVNFTAMDVVKHAGFKGDEAHKRTFTRYLNSLGYKYLITRRKGLLSDVDKTKRLQYARAMLKLLQEYPSFYINHIGFYLDAVSFVHKYNPFQESTSPKGRVWRKQGEGLCITAKGNKSLAGGRRVHMMVVIAYGKGVLVTEDYEHMNGAYFAQFVRDRMKLIFGLAGPKHNSLRLFVMDNDPSQNSHRALCEIEKIEAEIHAIPPRSPDLNPIENIFNTVKTDLEKEAISKMITNESFDEFKTRIKEEFHRITTHEVDKTINTMPKRLQAIVKSKGNRTKY
ncbi:uncharacterized protein LOC110250293 [Exaiptasia diaphana]|uniref:Tc1-like transposase DDE domain-containing protein n=1 Tax=Exaiptasia diaphana TaxID=2652724 RepID=A0A913XT07_EXADI|nr:uncharacterized protein LOC110246708 [Exaiptasia diaphana]XP_020912557.1 uncharacterized protein LOC110250293 [Exaiptasia diaphana]